MLSRNTEWRQGGILTHGSAHALGLCEKDATDKCAIVISHDCDLPNDKEEYVEVIIAQKISNIDSHFAAARNIRRLHLSCNNEDFLEIIELQHSGRRNVSKENFAISAKQDVIRVLSPEDKHSLKQWLAARYSRPAFPNAFETRLKIDKKFEEKLLNIIKPTNDYLIGIFFDLGEERFEELPPGTPYYLRISFVYESAKGPIARQIVEGCANGTTTLFRTTFGLPEDASELVLESCQAVADTLFSLADLRKTDQWRRFEYVSLRESPQSPHLAIETIRV